MSSRDEEEEREPEEIETPTPSPKAYAPDELTGSEWRQANAAFAPITAVSSGASRWQRRQAAHRPDLAPGSEYDLTISLTPSRNKAEHDPALWPDDLVDWDSPDDPANPR